MTGDACASPLATDRLMLARHGLADFDDSAAMWADPVVVRYIGGRPFSREEAWHRLLRYAGHWSLLGYGYWAIRERASDRFVGEIGFGNFKRDTSPALGDTPECGWALAPWAHGRGFGAEALACVLDWADRSRLADRTVCMIDEQNRASIRLAERFGYAALTTIDYKGARPTLFARDSAPVPD